MLNDFRLALRTLSRSPGFAGVAIVTLALGIGATTAIFSVVSGVLLRPLPYPQPDRLMQVQTVFQSGFAGSVSYPDFEDLQEQNHSFARLAAYSDWTTTAAASGEGFRVDWAQVSPGFFAVLGVAPALGRSFDADEERTGRPVAVVSWSYWQNRLGGAESLTGRTVRVNDKVYAVIGVMPRGYDFPVGAKLWVPREPATESRTAENWRVVGRLRAGVPLTAARQDLTDIARRLKRQYGDDTFMSDAAVRPILEQLVGSVRPALAILLGASGLLLLVACVNVANLLLARGLSRDRESAVRLALGAPAARLVRTVLAESLLLSLAGAGLGLVVALAGVPALLKLGPDQLPRARDIGVDWSVLAFSLSAAVFVGVGVGLFPGVRAARRDTREVLADSSRVQSDGPAGRRLRSTLVAAQIALTLVLLIGAGLLGRSFVKLVAVDPGFRTDGALVMDVWLPAGSLVSPTDAGASARIAEFIGRLMTRLRAVPGVDRVGGVNHFPLEDSGPNGTFLVLQRPDEVSSFDDFGRLVHERARTGNAEFLVASPDYFTALDIPLLRGRLFEARDTREAPHVAVISASLAEARWPGEDPLGKLIEFGNMDGDLRPFTIVGVVGDVQAYGLGAPAHPTFYVDYAQRPRTAFEFHVVIQSRADTAVLGRAATSIAHSLDPEVPVAFETLGEVVSASIADRRFLLFLVALFGSVALVLATTGVYGIVAYQAAQRIPEIGVRVALGAQRRDVVRLFLRQGAVLVAVGIGVGLGAAFVATRALASFVYGVATADPATYVASAFALAAAVLVASWIPAYRASQVDAIEALRHQ